MAPIGADEPPDLATAVVLAGLLVVVAEPALDALGLLEPVATTSELLVRLLVGVDDFVEVRPVMDNVGL